MLLLWWSLGQIKLLLAARLGIAFLLRFVLGLDYGAGIEISTKESVNKKVRSSLNRGVKGLASVILRT